MEIDVQELSMSTEIQLITADELLAMPDDGFVYELIKGELIKVSPPPGYEHGIVAMNIAGPLYEYIKKKNLGKVCAAETGFLLEQNPDTVRAADAAFVRRERVAQQSDWRRAGGRLGWRPPSRPTSRPR